MVAAGPWMEIGNWDSLTVEGFPQLNFPDVCTNEPQPSNAPQLKTPQSCLMCGPQHQVANL